MVYLDTPVFIYLIEQHNLEIARKAKNAIAGYAQSGMRLNTSVLAMHEFAMGYLRFREAEFEFEHFLSYNSINYLSVTNSNIRLATQLRIEAKKRFPLRKDALGPLDSMHLAIAIQNDCTEFLTNDVRLKSLTHLPLDIRLIEELG